jgi:BolA family transcriptional regulator, general stress-responsive regulator
MAQLRAQRIEGRVREAFSPAHLEVRDDSGQHAVPKGSESHWALLIVSGAFEGLSRVARHRAVYGALAPELEAGIHALKLETFTPSEWSAKGGAAASDAPLCLGGSKQDG